MNWKKQSNWVKKFVSCSLIQKKLGLSGQVSNRNRAWWMKLGGSMIKQFKKFPPQLNCGWTTLSWNACKSFISEPGLWLKKQEAEYLSLLSYGLFQLNLKWILVKRKELFSCSAKPYKSAPEMGSYGVLQSNWSQSTQEKRRVLMPSAFVWMILKYICQLQKSFGRNRSMKSARNGWKKQFY